MPDSPFSKELLALYQQWQVASKEERELLSIDFAVTALAEHDATDTDYSEAVHSEFEALQEAQLKFETGTLRISRMMVELIENYLESTLASKPSPN